MDSYTFQEGSAGQDLHISSMLNCIFHERGFSGTIMSKDGTKDSHGGNMWSIDQDSLEVLLEDLCVLLRVEPSKLEVTGQLSLF